MLLEPGQVFASRYRVLRCIAEGGMGAIFEAEHTAIERRVALKLLYPHVMSTASARQKFELEATISARVNSPHIVEVLDAGFDESLEAPFLVMELLEGQTLAERIYEQGPLAPREAIRLLQQVAAGLDAAHAYRDPDGTPKPIVHRDLKPENLFLARMHDGAVSAKILDYGIAKMLGGTTNLSQEVRGTPLFMAFEQITAGALSAQTDIWAFGLIAFYMLAGVHYWRSAEREGISVQSLFAEILTLPLELPSLRLREQGHGIELPPAFDAWLLCCIHRDPSQRFPTVRAAVEALGRAFDVVLEDTSPPRVRLLTSAERMLSISSAPAAAKAPSLGSLPAMTATQQPPAQPWRAPPSSPWRWVLAGVLTGALLLLGVISWLAHGESGPTAAAVPALEPPAVPSSPAGPSASAGAPSASSASSASSSPSGVDERSVEEPEPSIPSPDGPSSSDSRADALNEDSKRTSGADSSGGVSHAGGPKRGSKRARPKRQTRSGATEAYQIR